MNLIVGKHAVEEALAAGRSIDRLVIAAGSKSNSDLVRIISSAEKRKIKITTLPQSDIVSRYNINGPFQGVLAIVTHQNHTSLSDLIASSPSLLVMVDHIEDPYNLGAISRSAAAFGAQGIIYPKDRNATLTPGTYKAASGAFERLSLVKVTNLKSTIKELKKAGFWIYGADSNSGVSIEQVRFNKPAVLVLGNESKGIGPSITKDLDEQVHIPLIGEMESLNVSVASGIMLYTISSSFLSQNT